MNAATPERKPSTEQISGLIERVTFHSDESGLPNSSSKRQMRDQYPNPNWESKCVTCLELKYLGPIGLARRAI